MKSDIKYQRIYAVYGFGDFDQSNTICAVLKQLTDNHRPCMIIHGDDIYAFDKSLKKACELLSLETKAYPPKYKEHGRGARIRRNQGMAHACTHMVLFFNGHDKGVKHMFRQAFDRGKPIVIYNTVTKKITHASNPSPTIVEEVDGYTRMPARHPFSVHRNLRPRCSQTGRLQPFVLSPHYGENCFKRQRDDWKVSDEELPIAN